MSRKYGWKRDLPDHRDRYFGIWPTTETLDTVTGSVREQFPPILNQSELGSCTANGIANVHFFDQKKQLSLSPFLPSRLFIYYNERKAEGSVDYDSGASIRDGVKSISAQGACPEIFWPYEIDKFKDQPSETCYQQALKHQAILYEGVPQRLGAFKAVILAGWPIVFGFSVYESFESASVAKTGTAPMPGQNESLLGGHCVCAVGFDDVSQRITCANSWGETWGDKGFFTLPYDYIFNPNLADDFWVVRTVEV